MKKIILIICLLLAAAAIINAQDKPVKSSAAEHLKTAIEEQGLYVALKMFAELRKNPEGCDFTEEEFDALGNELLDKQQFEAAVAIFRLNVEMFPDSWIAYFNLATAYMYTGGRENAEENLKIVTGINPNFWLARFILSDLDQRIVRVADERERFYKPGEQTGLKGPYLGQEPPGMTAEMFAPGIVSRVLALNFSCTFSPDGKAFYYNHFMTIMGCYLLDDGWTAPEPADFTGGYRALEPHITLDGNKLYFTWFPPKPDDSQKAEVKFSKGVGIYVCKKSTEGWSEPKYVVKGGSATSSWDGKIYVSDRREEGHFQIKQGVLENGILAGFEPLGGGLADLSTQFPITSHPCISPDGRTILFDTSMKSGLWAAFLDESGMWSKPVKLSEHGLSAIAGIATYSPDGKYIFFNVGGDIYWISSEFVERLRPYKQRAIHELKEE